MAPDSSRNYNSISNAMQAININKYIYIYIYKYIYIYIYIHVCITYKTFQLAFQSTKTVRVNPDRFSQPRSWLVINQHRLGQSIHFNQRRTFKPDQSRSSSESQVLNQDHPGQPRSFKSNNSSYPTLSVLTSIAKIYISRNYISSSVEEVILQAPIRLPTNSRHGPVILYSCSHCSFVDEPS